MDDAIARSVAYIGDRDSNVEAVYSGVEQTD